MSTAQPITQELSRYPGSISFSWDGCTLSRQSTVRLSDDLTAIRSVHRGSFALRVYDEETPTTVWLDSEQASWLRTALNCALAPRVEAAQDGPDDWPAPMCTCALCTGIRDGEVAR